MVRSKGKPYEWSTSPWIDLESVGSIQEFVRRTGIDPADIGGFIWDVRVEATAETALFREAKVRTTIDYVGRLPVEQRLSITPPPGATAFRIITRVKPGEVEQFTQQQILLFRPELERRPPVGPPGVPGVEG
jgi:hypothetical protein